MNTLDKSQLNRRHFLRGLGAAVALPSMDSLRPLMAATAAAGTKQAAGTTASGVPLRMAHIYVPNGVNVAKWTPKGEGKDFQFSETHQAIKELRNDVQIFSGFENKNAKPGNDGAGGHARGGATFLTGCRARKTAGSDIEIGVSEDQVAARKMDHTTRLSSLELTCDQIRQSGGCDSGYSCAYQYNFSWRDKRLPMSPEGNPRLVFERMFGSGKRGERIKSFQKRLVTQKSILDFISDDAKSLHKKLGRNDQQKLDEYLNGVREIERRIEFTEKKGNFADPNADSPPGIPDTRSEHMRLMFDMMALAFQTDMTRISTFLMAAEGSNRGCPEVGVSEGHHNLSHHQSNQDKLEKIARIDRFHMEQFAYFLKKLKSMKDSDGKSVLENSMIMYGSGISDGNRHNHDELPIILAGHGGGVFKTGRHVKTKEKVPLSNLHLSMLNQFGVQDRKFGDSSEVFRDI